MPPVLALSQLVADTHDALLPCDHAAMKPRAMSRLCRLSLLLHREICAAVSSVEVQGLVNMFPA